MNRNDFDETGGCFSYWQAKNAAINFPVEAGSVAQKVEVKADAAQLVTTTSAILPDICKSAGLTIRSVNVTGIKPFL